MPLDILIAIIGFATASSITPGPNNLLVMTSGLNYGLRRSMPLILGISLGFAFMLLAVGFGLGAVIQARPELHTAAMAGGLAYMLWLAWKVAVSQPTFARPDDESVPPPLSALAGAAFQWINPKAWAVALSATAAFSTPGAEAGRLYSLAGVFALVAVASLALWTVFGGVFRMFVESPGIIRTINILMALVLAVSAVPIAVELAQRF